MRRLWNPQWLSCLVLVLACSGAWASEEGQALLDKAIETKFTAEKLGDLNEVIKLCQQALEKGLDEGNTAFANEVLASTLAQRAEMLCMELFERPVTPVRARKLVEMALSDLQATLKINPKQPDSQFLIGRLYAQLGQKDEAIAALGQCVEQSEDPLTQSKALMLRANLQNDPAARQADLDRAVELTPHSADVLRLRGMFQLSQNKLDGALEDFNAAIEIDEEDEQSYEMRGVVLSLLKKYDEAMESFNKALELEPDSPAVYTHRARVRAMKGDMQAALRDVDHALKLQPTSVAALQLRSNIYGTLGKLPEALADLEKVKAVMPNHPDVLLQSAMLYQASREPHKALEAYNRLVAKEPENVAALRGRADTFLSLAKQAEAITDYERAAKLEPNNSGVLNNLAWVLATSPDDKLRDGKRAVEIAKIACEITEYKQAHILSTLAAAYAEAGDFDTAVTWSEKAVELGEPHLKPQLSKELESYREKKPWREEAPPLDALSPDQTARPNQGAQPADGDTARGKRGN